MKNTNILDQSGFRLINLGNAVGAQDAVPLSQVQALIQGFSWKAPVRVKTTANITLSGTQTIDGVAVVANDRVLVANQSNGAQNGIYTGASGAWVRAQDADTGAELVGASVFVSEGTAGGNTVWLQTTDAPITPDTTALIWMQVGGSGAAYTAGNGLSLSANQFSIDPAVVTRKFAADIGDGSATTLSVTHNLNTLDVQVQVRLKSTGEQVLVDNVANGVNTVQLTFGTAPAAGAYRVLVQG